MSVGSDFFVSNRIKLRELFGGTAPIVISGNSQLQKSADSSYPFTQDSNFWYLTGLNEQGLVLVMEVDKEYLILPKADSRRDIFDGAADLEDIKTRSGVNVICDHDLGWKQLSKRLAKVKHVATIQPPPSFIPELNMFTNPSKKRLLTQIKSHNEDINLIDVRSFLANMRSVKQASELRLIQDATKYTQELYELLEQHLDGSDYEYQLMAESERFVRLNDLDFAYEPIIASGKNALTLHYSRNNSKLDKEKFLLVDMGAKYKYYNSDITRTIVRNPSKRQQKVFQAVLSVQDFAVKLLKPGANLITYEDAVQQFMGEKLRELGLIKSINNETVRKFFPHLASHHLGIDVHDVGERENNLVPGMVLTVEPGIYIENEQIAVRIEDMILITESGNQIISKNIPKYIDKFA